MHFKVLYEGVNNIKVHPIVLQQGVNNIKFILNYLTGVCIILICILMYCNRK